MTSLDMILSRFNDEPWHRAAQAERRRFRELMRRSGEIRDRVGAACRDLDAAMREARRLMEESKAERMVRGASVRPGMPGQVALTHLLRDCGLDDEDLPDLLDGLIAAYRDAVANDDRAVATLGRALRTIGWHLAQELGPREAGVTLN